MWYVLKSPSLALSVRDDLKKAGLKFFLPTRTVLVPMGGKTVRVEKPLAFNLVFVSTDIETLHTFKSQHPDRRLHIAYQRPLSYQQGDYVPPLVVPDREMEMFINAVGTYRDAEIPYMKPSEVDLEKGDIVRIVAGPFNGIEGVLLSQQGKEGGRVLVNVSNVIAVPTLHIEPEYLQVLQFAKKGKHFYKLVDSYVPRLRKAMEEVGKSGRDGTNGMNGSNGLHGMNGASGKNGGNGTSGRSVKAAVLDPVRVFTTRFCNLQADTLNAEAKVQALLLASYRLLGEEEKAMTAQAKLDELLPRVKSASTLEFVKGYISKENSSIKV
ncbi:MAG: UpxY family transcription antiterminator [Bacteroidaceae bacterium]|nr:UpxY family transcription antiterminator [Bacteroidaceae bacterium]